MTLLTTRLFRLFLLGALFGPGMVQAQTKPSFLRTKAAELNPAGWVRTGTANYRAGNWIARDLSVHDSWGKAVHRSFFPSDRAANVRSVGTLKMHGVSLAQSFLRPAIIELQRQAGSGKGFDGSAMARAMHPVPIATTFGASWLGAAAGASLQSSLTAFGPAGAIVGVFARATGGIGGSLVGYALGTNLVEGKKPFLQILKESFSDLELGRDGGNIVGSTIGGILGQTLIPIPVVGGIIGSIIGGTIGIAVGEGIAAWWRKRQQARQAGQAGPRPPPGPLASRGSPPGQKSVHLLEKRSGG